MSLSEIEVRELPEQPVVVVRHRISMRETTRIPAWIAETVQAAEQSGRPPTGMPFVRTLAMEAEEMDIEVGWPVAAARPVGTPADGEVHDGLLPGGLTAVASYFGPYEEIAPAYATMQAWCAEHGYAIAGAPWESYANDPEEEPDSSKWRTDIHFPVRAG